jgi:hypothetical protein
LGHLHTIYQDLLLICNYEAVEDFVSWMKGSPLRCLRLIVGTLMFKLEETNTFHLLVGLRYSNSQIIKNDSLIQHDNILS